MSDAKIERYIGYTIIALLVGDLLLMWKLAYGCYPWESGGGAPS